MCGSFVMFVMMFYRFRVVGLVGGFISIGLKRYCLFKKSVGMLYLFVVIICWWLVWMLLWVVGLFSVVFKIVVLMLMLYSRCCVIVGLCGLLFRVCSL